MAGLKNAPAAAATAAGATVMTNVEAVRTTLHDALERDERVLILGEDVGARGNVFLITKGFLEEFGSERVIDTPLAEASIVGVAIGMAMEGLRPVAEIQFADFIYPAFNQIVGEAAKTRYRSNGEYTCPLVIRTPYGGGVRGALSHSVSIEALFYHVPGPQDRRALVSGRRQRPAQRGHRRCQDPVLFLEHKKTYRSDQRRGTERSITRFRSAKPTCCKAGTAAHGRFVRAVTCIGRSKPPSNLKPVRIVSIEVIDLRSIRPMDRDDDPCERGENAQTVDRARR